MTPYDQASRWLCKQPSAISGDGGHNQTFSVACCLVHGFTLSHGDALTLLARYNVGCQPPWTESALNHKLLDAERSTPSKPRGYMLRQSTEWGLGDRRASGHLRDTSPGRLPDARNDGAKRAASREILRAPTNLPLLPEPIADGARALIKAAFDAGEGVRIVNAKLNEEDREIPADAGTVLSREEWLRKLDEAKGNPNGIWSSSKKTGIYISINPMRVGGSKDSDVTDFRHALIEFDNLSREEQWNLYEKSNLPCSAIISSGGKSIHAWVRVGASNRQEYEERVKALYAYFGDSGLDIDTKNKNPSRFSRLPNCVRFESRQELLALNTGAESFTQWLSDLHLESVGEEKTVDYLLKYDTQDKSQWVLGRRWLCKGGSCVINGPSGFGKSSLELQMASLWAVGRDFCGVIPVKPLKSLIIQAENDDGDLAEVLQSLYAVRLGLLTPDEDALFRRNVVFRSVTSRTGADFVAVAQRLLDKYRPDLCWLDPLAAFAGDDLSKQTTIASFLRNGLQPVIQPLGTVLMIINHIPKPSADPKIRARSDQYAGAGSYDLPGWSRAGISLRANDEVSKSFEIKFTKRGSRAGATHPDGTPTETVNMRWGHGGIYWEQIPPSSEPTYVPKKPGRPEAQWNLKEFVGTLTGEDLTREEIKSRAMSFGGFKHAHFESKIWAPLKENLTQKGKLWTPK